MTKQLYFDYPSTSRIRIKKENCLQHDSFPLIYRIRTKRLDFIVPRVAVIITAKHVYIPLEYYRTVLNKYYSSITP